MSSTTISLVRRLHTANAKTTFFTTPIYYVNANPHIGHLYSSLIADAAQRWHKIRHPRKKIKFSTGTDEHGTKIQQAAHKNKTSLPEYCDQISNKYKQLAEYFSVEYTDFVRTTDEKHQQAVKSFWTRLKDNGFIYSAKYKGWYCVADESFLTEAQLKQQKMHDGQSILVSAESGHPVEWTEEENYMFRLSSVTNDVRHWINGNENLIRPKKFQKILLNYLNDEDLSVSRPASRVQWGIRVPGDDTQSIYVWLDALVNYLTVAGFPHGNQFSEVWPPDVQVIGKDILKFHGIYWPAFLIAAGLQPPNCILCHSHWTVNDEKMSKSKNNVICPFDRSSTYTSDGLRYFLLREGTAHSDGNYSDAKVLRILNSELADTLGNLLSRCCGTSLNPKQVFPGRADKAVLDKITQLDVTKKLIEELHALPGVCEDHFQNFNFYKAADAVVSVLHSANLFFETLKPWELKKNTETAMELDCVLNLAMETLRISGILLQPLIPNIASRLLNKLNVPEGERFFTHAEHFSRIENAIPLASDKTVLFRRIMPQMLEKKINEV